MKAEETMREGSRKPERKTNQGTERGHGALVTYRKDEQPLPTRNQGTRQKGVITGPTACKQAHWEPRTPNQRPAPREGRDERESRHIITTEGQVGFEVR